MPFGVECALGAGDETWLRSRSQRVR
jgi:hypothetical protein